MNAFNKGFAALTAVVAPAVSFNPLVFTVGIKNDAKFGERGRVCC